MPNTDEAERWFDLGCEALKPNRYTQAEKCFTRALRFSPGWHEALQRRAYVRECVGNSHGARRDYLSALKSAPQCQWCWSGLADVYQKQGRYRDAVKGYGRAARIDPRDASFRNDLAWMHLAVGEYRKAIALFEKLLNTHGFEYLAPLGLGKARALSGDSKRAMRAFDQCVRLRPDDAACWLNRGLLRLMTGDRTTSLEDFRKARDLSKGEATRGVRKVVGLLRRRSSARELDFVIRKALHLYL